MATDADDQVPTYDVLIVEDHADTGRLLRRVFRGHGLRAEVAESGLAALALLDRSGQPPPRCLLLDQMMPAMTGLELLRLLRARPAYQDVPAYFYSAAHEWQPQAEAEALGARQWFVKGVTPIGDVVAQVKACCAAN